MENLFNNGSMTMKFHIKVHEGFGGHAKTNLQITVDKRRKTKSNHI